MLWRLRNGRKAKSEKVVTFPRTARFCYNSTRNAHYCLWGCDLSVRQVQKFSANFLLAKKCVVRSLFLCRASVLACTGVLAVFPCCFKL
jgi:hypothetical protein